MSFEAAWTNAETMVFQTLAHDTGTKIGESAFRGGLPPDPEYRNGWTLITGGGGDGDAFRSGCFGSTFMDAELIIRHESLDEAQRLWGRLLEVVSDRSQFTAEDDVVKFTFTGNPTYSRIEEVGGLILWEITQEAEIDFSF